MVKKSSKITFEILIDDSFLGIDSTTTLVPVTNKRVLSIINDFEDGKWRFSKFQNFIWNNISETSLSYKERECLIDEPYSMLKAAAQNLRLTDNENNDTKGSELAEIVLYGIMKNYYNALPIVPKIFYKQNNQDNAKGSDSVHIVLEENNEFSLWFGEAKFYNSIEDSRLTSIINSVKNSLITDKIKKENSIITNIKDINYLIKDPLLREKVVQALDINNSIDGLRPKLHIPILLLHECEITKNCNSLSESYKLDITNYHIGRAKSYFGKQIKAIGSLHMYKDIKFHIILFPVPSKSDIIDKFIENAKNLKDIN